MPLNKSVGQMYSWVTHTWNTIKGKCPHLCTYCYMNRYGNQKPVRFDYKEFETDLGSGNYIFVGSSCDMFADNIPYEWTRKTLEYCRKFDNTYLFQTKNPNGFYLHDFPDKTRLCTTIETNRWIPEIMGNSPQPRERSILLGDITAYKKYVTIEPIMDFDLDELISFIRYINPVQVNIGADTGNNKLPEPSKMKVIALINALMEFTIIDQKHNLKRLLK